MHHRALKTAVVNIQQAEKAITSELDGIVTALRDLDELLGELSGYSRRLSIVVEGLPEHNVDLRVNELEGPVSPELVCNPAAIHLQAAAAGIDQARTAVDVAHRLAGRLHLQPQ
jgi:hypothetical protein